MAEQSNPLSPGQVSALIDHLLKSRDPAVVGLRRILKKKEAEADTFPLHSARYEEFSTPGREQVIFSQDERRALELEKQNNELSQTISNLKEKLPQEIQKAFELGLIEGKKKGEEIAHEKAAASYNQKLIEVQKRVADLLSAIETEKKGIFMGSWHLVTRLTMECAKKIVHTELTINPRVVLSVVKKALTFIADRDRMIVRVDAHDLETLSGNKDFWAPVTERLTNITLEPDDKVTRGGCIIESNTGMVDARFGVQLAELESLIEKTWQDMASAPMQNESRVEAVPADPPQVKASIQ